MSEQTRQVTRIEWGLVLGLAMQAAALIWGAAKLTAGVDQIRDTIGTMSDYSVIRYRVDKLEADNVILRRELDNVRTKR